MIRSSCVKKMPSCVAEQREIQSKTRLPHSLTYAQNSHIWSEMLFCVYICLIVMTTFQLFRLGKRTENLILFKWRLSIDFCCSSIKHNKTSFRGTHGGSVGRTVASARRSPRFKSRLSNESVFCVELTRSSRVCVGFLQVHQFLLQSKNLHRR